MESIMINNISEENIFAGFEFLAAEPISKSIKIYHPFASLANRYFSNKGYDITPLECGSVAISFENLTKEEKIELSKAIKDFLKNSREKVIKDFLMYKKVL